MYMYKTLIEHTIHVTYLYYYSHAMYKFQTKIVMNECLICYSGDVI